MLFRLQSYVRGIVMISLDYSKPRVRGRQRLPLRCEIPVA